MHAAPVLQFIPPSITVLYSKVNEILCEVQGCKMGVSSKVEVSHTSCQIHSGKAVYDTFGACLC